MVFERTAVDSLSSSAVAAWRLARPGGAMPSHVQVLKGPKDKKTVYRLVAAGLAGTDVIAKRYRIASGHVERTMYDEVLARVPAPCLRCYGLVEEVGGVRCWLFLEDARGDEYALSNAEHHALAGRWLGLVHTSTPSTVAARLPDRGPQHFRQRLHEARANIEANRGNRALSAEQGDTLDAMLRRLDWLDQRWGDIDDVCSAMPATIVHGDFVPKNLRVRRSASGAALMCFDWGTGGWGIPAIDLAQNPASSTRFAADPDLVEYWNAVRRRWPLYRLDTVHEWARVGSVFRALSAIAWAARSLGSEWPHTHIAEMALAHDVIASALQATVGSS